MRKIYLAAPYAHSDPEVMQHRVQQADGVAADLMQRGYAVFSPLTHSHRVARHIGNHLSHDFWLAQDFEWLAACDELWILMLLGYKESFGVNMECEQAAEWNMPIRKVNTRGEAFDVCISPLAQEGLTQEET